MPVEQFILAFTSVLLGVIGFIAWYSSHRSRSFSPTLAEDQIFRCTDCRTVYTDDLDVDLSRCPQCGKMNAPFRF